MHLRVRRAPTRTVTVTTTTDETTTGKALLAPRGDSLRQRHRGDRLRARPPSGTTTIILPSGTYPLSGGTLSLTRDATIARRRRLGTTISGGGPSRCSTSARRPGRRSAASRSREGQRPHSVREPTVLLRPERTGRQRRRDRNAGTLTLVNSVVCGNTASAGRTQTSSSCALPFGDSLPPRGERRFRWRRRRDLQHRHDDDRKLDHRRQYNAGRDGTEPAPPERPTRAPGGGRWRWQRRLGAGIHNDRGTTTITGSTICGNNAGPGGNGGPGQRRQLRGERRRQPGAQAQGRRRRRDRQLRGLSP